MSVVCLHLSPCEQFVEVDYKFNSEENKSRLISNLERSELYRTEKEIWSSKDTEINKKVRKVEILKG